VQVRERERERAERERTRTRERNMEKDLALVYAHAITYSPLERERGKRKTPTGMVLEVNSSLPKYGGPLQTGEKKKGWERREGRGGKTWIAEGGEGESTEKRREREE